MNIRKQIVKLIQNKEKFKDDKQNLIRIEMTIRVLDATIQHLNRNKMKLLL